MALVAVACVLAAWLAGPAHANGPVEGVPASVTAVQQVTAPVVRTIESSPVRTAASPGRPAARVHRARAAVADSVEVVATASQPAADRAATAVETVSNATATAVETASKSELPKRVAATVRVASKHAADGVRSAPRRTAAAGHAAQQLDAAVNTVAKLGIATAAPRDGGAPARFAGATTSTGVTLPTIAVGHAIRHAAASGWRHATAGREAPIQPLDRAVDALAGFANAATQPGSPSSAATGLAGAAAAALLGLFAFLIFSFQRPGALVWLRPASAPASPFLALPERPG